MHKVNSHPSLTEARLITRDIIRNYSCVTIHYPKNDNAPTLILFKETDILELDRIESEPTKESINPETSNPEKPQPSKRAIIMRRLAILFVLSSLLVISIVCRLTLNWSRYLGEYCVYDNGTFFNLKELNDTITTMNCSIVTP